MFSILGVRNWRSTGFDKEAFGGSGTLREDDDSLLEYSVQETDDIEVRDASRHEDSVGVEEIQVQTGHDYWLGRLLMPCT